MTERLQLPVFDKPVKLLIVAVAGEAALVAASQARVLACDANITTELLQVPSVHEVPVAIAMAERLADFDGYVALGAAHGAAQPAVWHSISLLGLQGVCIGNGIGAHEGAAAVEAALHLVAISRKWAAETKGIGFRP